ncbi:MAG: 50S ribosomal protein L32 [Candidatus Binatia bacterium]
MAVPKRRTSKSKRDSRRSHDALPISAQSLCSNCGARLVPHRACPACGYYKGRQVIGASED